MDTTPISLVTVRELRQHVLETLCGRHDLDPRCTPMLQSIVERKGNPCGLFFHIQGPRLLKAYAVWSGDDNRILFYDAGGDRFAETQLSEGPDLSELAAARVC